MSRRGMQVKALLSMGILVGFGAVSTLAAWSGTATATSTISAATVSLGVGKTAVDTSTYTVPLDSTDWYPGMSQAAVVVVNNTSSIAASYSITGKVVEKDEGSLGKALLVDVTSGIVTGTSPEATCTGASLLTKEAGADFLERGSEPVELALGASETLCVQYSLPTTADNALQGNSTKVKLAFTATVGS